MVIIRVIGGLGNQLYQYALYEKLKSLGKDVKLDITDYMSYAREPERRALELKYFDNLPFEVCTLKERYALTDDNQAFFQKVRRKLFGKHRNIYVEKEDYSPEIFDLNNVYLDGFWNCEKYYEDRIPYLQEKIVFPKSANPKNEETAKRMLSENSVSIHIRRSDYLDECRKDRYGNICTDAYYERALSYVMEKLGEVKVYVFSDDIPYVKEKFQGKDYTIVDWNSDKDCFYDMMLMSKCAANICANSTFSMWGARLNKRPDKIMIRPFKHDNTQNFSVEYMKDTWKNWVLIKEEGTIVHG